MAQGSYQQFCPVSMASEVLCTRWTIVLLRELICGSTRFNDLRRGIPRMSPALLSQRLKDLEAHGIVHRVPAKDDPGIYEYHLTRAGEELRPIVEAFGFWGQRWIDKDVSMKHLDAQLLMWDMRRKIDPKPWPMRRSVIQFLYPEQEPLNRNWWLIVKAQESVELCWVDPGFDVDLYCASDLRTMTEIWMGHDTVKAALSDDRLKLTGDKELASKMQTWLGLSLFANEKPQAVAG